jgi:hypothetical protein
MGYQLEGKLLEVCNCDVLCPCWVGEDPDYGTCDDVTSYHIERGQINGIDVSGLTMVQVDHVPGNILKGNFRTVFYLDDIATPEQHEALVNAWTGKLGGPLADISRLIGEVVAVERVPIIFEVEKGKGRIKIGEEIEAELAPFIGATGNETTLHDSIYTSIPGSPAYMGKASKFMAKIPKLGWNINLQGQNAIQGSFRFTS